MIHVVLKRTVEEIGEIGEMIEENELGVMLRRHYLHFDEDIDEQGGALPLADQANP